MKKHTLLAVLSLLIAFSGCTSRYTDFTLITTKNHRIHVPESSMGNRVYGEDKAVWVLYFPLGMPSVKTAIDRAIESAGPGYDALVDGVVDRYFLWFVVGFIHGYQVEGTPIRTADLSSELLRQGHDPKATLAEMNILYHSNAGVSNTAAVGHLLAAQ